VDERLARRAVANALDSIAIGSPSGAIRTYLFNLIHSLVHRVVPRASPIRARRTARDVDAVHRSTRARSRAAMRSTTTRRSNFV